MSVFWWIATKDNEQYVVVKLYKQAVSEEVPSVTMSFLMHALELKLQFCWIINLFYHVPRKYIKLGGVWGGGGLVWVVLFVQWKIHHVYLNG